jgi:hypothetical protein
MAQFIWLETGRWINVEHIVLVEDDAERDVLVVSTTLGDGLGAKQRLSGGAREQLLAYLRDGIRCISGAQAVE